ncbi:hypothetical protein [Actinophytocola algeriensis]|uniref:Uncharacterized protein n=1 Tax=Actinophytocola algeriensis TaxID=1768010 RepID=A0A7W7PZW6_9PSEU|nr:hypothetical protein [Actinophytocola algeriensis]MBB4904278.1 hypothetical protein [Actinophytocola algeriensis]MBE1476864.1 hypothetical protein [Actinophytocola algeriensis]
MSTFPDDPLVAQRMLCTGETLNSVRRSGVRPIPDSDCSVQQYLEASILLAWSEMTWLRRVFGRETHSFVAVTHPHTDMLTIGVPNANCLVPLLGRVLPMSSGNVVTGIPGLRVQVERRHMELYLDNGRKITAKVRFRCATDGQFRTMLKRIAHGHPDERPLFHAKDMFSRERNLFIKNVIPAAPLLSGILRRILLWRTAPELYLGVYRQRVAIMWFDGPPARTVVEILGHSTCAIPSALLTQPFSAPTGTAGSQSSVQHIEVTSALHAPAAGRGASSEHQHIVPTAHSTQRLRTGPSPCVADNSASTLLWMPLDMQIALEKQRFTAVFRLLRRIGLTDADIGGFTGQSSADVHAVLRGDDIASRDMKERIAELIELPGEWL